MEIVQLPQAPSSVPRDGYGRPLIVPKTGGRPVAHTRTTTFIDCIESKDALVDWDKRCVLIGAAMKPDLLAGVLALNQEDPDDKRRLNALAEKAKETSGANEKREKGTRLHALTEAVDAGIVLPESTPPEDVADMAAYMMATLDFEVIHAERLVVVNELATAGTPDRVSRYDGPGPTGRRMKATLITDLKTGNVEYGKLKMAMQLAVYAHGEHYDHTVFPAVDTADKKAFAAWKKIEHSAELAATAYTPQVGINKSWGVIISLPAGSGECTLHWVDLRVGWKAAKLALKVRQARSIRNAMIPWFAG